MKGSLFCLLLVASVGAASVSAAEESDRERVVVWRGDVSVTLAEVDSRIAEIPTQHRAVFINDPDRIEKLLRDLLLIEQLAGEARRDGLDRDPELAGQIRLATDRILATRRLHQVALAKAPGDYDALAHEVYVTNPATFRIPDVVEVRHILVKRDCRSSEAARTLAGEYRERALAHDVAFGELASEVSEDEGSRKHGGRITVMPGQTAKAFEAAAFALDDVGEISPVVETEFGFHVIKLEKKTPGRQQSFDEVKGDLIPRLRDERNGRLVKEHTDKLSNEAIEADADLVASLRTRYGTVARIPGTEGTEGSEPAQPATPEND